MLHYPEQSKALQGTGKNPRLRRCLISGYIYRISDLDPETHEPISFYAELRKTRENGKIVMNWYFVDGSELDALGDLEFQEELSQPVTETMDSLETLEQFFRTYNLNLHVRYRIANPYAKNPNPKFYWEAWLTDSHGNRQITDLFGLTTDKCQTPLEAAKWVLIGFKAFLELSREFTALFSPNGL